MGRKIKGRNHRPCESANIQANINADPTMEEIAAACTGCSCDQARRPLMGGRIRIGTLLPPFTYEW